MATDHNESINPGVNERRRKVADLTEAGWSAPQIAKTFNVTERTIIFDRAFNRRQKVMRFVPEHKERNQLSPDIVPLLENTPEAFEAFFNRYSEWTLAPHSLRFVKAAFGKEAVLLNVPPRHAKTEVFSVWFPIWRICQNPDVQILLISNTRDQALKPFRDIENHLRSNPKLLRDFGRFKPEDRESPWSTSTGQLMVSGRHRHEQSGDLTLMVRGANQGIYGFAADLIVADDVVDEENVATPDRRDKLAHWFHNIVESRLQPVAQTIVIGTRFHEDDLYGHLAAMEDYVEEDEPDFVEGRKLWEHINFPAVSDWTAKEVLWPDVWSFRKLMAKRKRVTPPVFDQAYQQNPIPSDMRLAQPEWLDGCMDRQRRWGLTEKKGARIVSIDPSPTKMAGLIVCDLEPSKEKFAPTLLEIQRRRMGVREMMSELERIGDYYHPDYFILEKNAAQRWFFEDLEFEAWKRKYHVRPLEHNTDRNKADPAYGFQSLGADFEFGCIRLPYGDQQSRDMSRIVVEEAISYPYGRYDDVLMAIWFVKINARKLRPREVVSLTDVDPRRFHVPTRLKRGMRGLVSA